MSPLFQILKLEAQEVCDYETLQFLGRQICPQINNIYIHSCVVIATLWILHYLHVCVCTPIKVNETSDLGHKKHGNCKVELNWEMIWQTFCPVFIELSRGREGSIDSWGTTYAAAANNNISIVQLSLY